MRQKSQWFIKKNYIEYMYSIGIVDDCESNFLCLVSTGSEPVIAS